MASMYLERIDSANYDHLDRYMALLEKSRAVPEVAELLPEIFEEGSVHRILAGIRGSGAMRYFISVDGTDAGRLELTRHLNDDPSIVERVPEGIELGFNTCYLLNPALIGRNHVQAHRQAAFLGIKEAFKQGDEQLGTAPWLPVSTELDPSMGWLIQPEDTGYKVIIGETQTGFFPQFQIDHLPLQLVYAVQNQEQ